MGLRGILIGEPEVFFPEVKLVKFNDEIGMVQLAENGALFTASQVLKLKSWSQLGLEPYNIIPKPDGLILVTLKDENLGPK